MTAPEPERLGAGVLETDPPAFTTEEAAEVARTVFGLAGDVKELGSERDQNFLIDDGHGSRGVLKISNLGDPASILDMETEAALLVARMDPELPVATPRPVPGADGAIGAGAYRASVPSPGGSGTHLVRMFEHMPGRGSVDPTELGHDALWDFGVVVARLGRALRGFFHPAAGRVLLWDVRHTAELRPLVASIEDPRRRRIVKSVLDRFEVHVAPRWPGLRAQVIHGDVTLDNALVDRRGRVTGLVDFGDMSHTALLCDVSSALTSLLSGRKGEDVFRSSDAFVDGFQTVTPLEDGEHALIADLLAARLAATAAISAWRVARYPDNEYIRSWDTDTWLLLEMLDELGFDEAADRLGGGYRSGSASSVEDLTSRRRVFGSALSTPTYDQPLHLVRGEGVWLFDAEGRRYLDAYNNVPVVGHCHPRITEAIVRQARSLNTNMRYLHEAAVELAERLVGTMPEGSGLDTVMLVNSGSEANDLAWRLATVVTDHAGGIVTEHAYHGVTAAISDLSPEEWRSGVRPSHVETIPPPDPFRGLHRREADWVQRSAAEVTGAFDRLASRDIAPAAVFVDGGFTSDGILTPPPSYLQEVLTRTHEAGAILVADEVQVGHGRTGEHLWSFHGAGITPDIVTLGKPMGNGHPVAAVITRSDIVDRFARTTEFFSTFGGNPVAAVAGLAVLDVIRDQGLVDHAAEIGGALRDALEGLATRHEAIGDVRGTGLLIGVDLVADRASRHPDPTLAARVVNRLRERGILVGTTGRWENVLKVRPPLVFGSEHVDLLVSGLDEALAEFGTER
ncbi:MAG: aminotransferase class III-fold pyridoxal phosphate-dependent enzyme [Actinomycetota bacterium]